MYSPIVVIEQIHHGNSFQGFAANTTCYLWITKSFHQGRTSLINPRTFVLVVDELIVSGRGAGPGSKICRTVHNSRSCRYGTETQTGPQKEFG